MLNKYCSLTKPTTSNLALSNISTLKQMINLVCSNIDCAEDSDLEVHPESLTFWYKMERNHPLLAGSKKLHFRRDFGKSWQFYFGFIWKVYRKSRLFAKLVDDILWITCWIIAGCLNLICYISVLTFALQLLENTSFASSLPLLN